MSKATLALSLSRSDGLDDPYWLHLEEAEDIPDDGMTVAEAADMIDAAYNINVCVPPEEQGTPWNQLTNGNRDIWQQPTEEVEEIDNTVPTDTEDFKAQERFAEKITFAMYDECGKDDTDRIAFTSKIKVFRSHRSEEYKLQFLNGEQRVLSRHQGRVIHTVDVENETSITMNNPIISNAVVSWQGDNGGEIGILGNTLYWALPFTGTIRAEFDTEWDEVLIDVINGVNSGADLNIIGFTAPNGDTDDRVTCTVLGFYHYEYESLSLNEPQEDTSTTETDKVNICHFIVRVVDTDPGDSKTNSEICAENCGDVSPEAAKLACKTTFDSCMSAADGDQEERYKCSITYESCLASSSSQKDPDCVERCNEPKCEQHVNETVKCRCDGREETDSHYEKAPCPAGVSDGSTLEGSVERTTYKSCGYYDEANDPEVYEEKCCIKWPFDKSMPQCKKIVTKFTGKSDAEFDESSYPEGTSFVTVSPADGQCGETLTEQVLHAKNCCGDNTSMYFTKTHDKVAWNTDYVFCVAGGAPPYSWSSTGKGLNISGSGECAQLHVTDCFCNPGVISVTDSCGQTIGHGVTSEEGAWEIIGEDSCAKSGLPVTEQNGFWFIAETDKYKVSERWLTWSHNGTKYYEEAGYNSIQEWICASLVNYRKGCIDMSSLYLHGACDNGSGITVQDGVEFDDPVKGMAFTGTIVAKYAGPETDLTTWEWKCEDVEELAYDDENSVEVIADNSVGRVFVIGGKPPYTWAVSGQGFSFKGGLTEAETSHPQIDVYTTDACGSASVTCSDRCEGTVSGSIKAAEGRWVAVDNVSCDESGMYGIVGEQETCLKGGGDLCNSVYAGNVKYQQRFSYYYASGTYGEICKDSLGECPRGDWRDYLLPLFRDQCSGSDGILGTWDERGCITWVQGGSVIWEDECAGYAVVQCGVNKVCETGQCQCQIFSIRRKLYYHELYKAEWTC